MSYVALPFPFGTTNPEDLEGLFAFSDKDSKLEAAQSLKNTFAEGDPEAQRRSALGLSSSLLQGNTGNTLPSPLRGRLVDLLQHQAQAGYQLTFIFKPKTNNNTQTNTPTNTFNELGQKIGLKALPEKTETLTRFTLPHAPLLSINMKNNIVSKVVSRRPEGEQQTFLSTGSIKERWGISDIEINITGIFLFKHLSEYPLYDIRNLYKLLQEGHVGVQHTLLNAIGIHHVIIQSLNLPPTKGNNQRYSLKAISDNEDYELLQETNNGESNP